MQRALFAVQMLIETNATHRLGFTAGEVQPPFILERAQAELDELKAAPFDPEELGDLLGCLLHLAAVQGWSLHTLEDRMLAKFRKRFTLPPSVDPDRFWQVIHAYSRTEA